MTFKHIIFLFIIAQLWACKQEPYHLTKIKGKTIEITDSLPADLEIENFISPYKKHIQRDLDSVLAFAPQTYSKSDGDLNTAIGNFMADAIYEQANPVFKSRTGKDIDMVLLNHGGIRSILSKGNITTRTAYKIMPFENTIVVVALKGKQIDSLIGYLRHQKKPHPISKMKLTLNANYEVINATIKGKQINSESTYFIATSDYLYNNGDNMGFFKPNDSLYVLDYKVRNALIDYFKMTDTINPVIDDRFIKINP
ncbi:5'-nucleotidase C-terminal domain-containing protein [Changchengzhania lutea]|uniref:5'-nucleotidase C-terminal domain-containing protein n=1 Tax=Changchengzhania lutea TaxID=2049305 RepID=UPI00115D61A0|nr:5'-nucleotidase [Changchengzhania lutea]